MGCGYEAYRKDSEGHTVLEPLVWAQACGPFPGPLVNMDCAGRAVLESGLCMASVGFCFAHTLAQTSYP